MFQADEWATVLETSSVHQEGDTYLVVNREVQVPVRTMSAFTERFTRHSHSSLDRSRSGTVSYHINVRESSSKVYKILRELQ